MISVKRIIAYVLAITIVALLCTCSGFAVESEMKEADRMQSPDAFVEPIQVKTGVGSESKWQDDIQLVKFRYGIVRLTEAYKVLYPELALAIDNYGETELEILNESFLQMVPDAKVQAECGAFYGPYEINESVTVRRADSNVTSLLYSTYYYSGGAHGSMIYTSATFDSQTGEQLMLSDIVTDGALLELRAQEELDYWYGDVAYFDEDPLVGYYSDLNDMYHCWTLDQNGLTLYFNIYELAPYSEGAQIVTIPFIGNEDLFYSGRDKVPESYVSQMSLGVPYYLDIGNDGSLDCLYLNSWMDEYGSYNSLYISVNGQQTQQELFGFEILPMVIHTSAGKDVIYVQVTAENDFHSMYGYVLDEQGAVNLAGAFNVGFDSDLDEMGTVRYMQILPAMDTGLWLSTRIWLLGTVSGEKCYWIGDDGVLYTYDTQYCLNYPKQLTLKVDLEGYLIEEATLETTVGIESCPQGTVVEWIRTDGIESADLQLPSGNVIRVYVNREEWPYTISGMNIEDIFDGMLFAG